MNKNKKIMIFCIVVIGIITSLFVYKSSNKNSDKQAIKNNNIEESNLKEEKKESDNKDISNKKANLDIEDKDNKIKNEKNVDEKINTEEVKRRLKKRYYESKKGKEKLKEKDSLENLSINKKVFKKNFEEENINIDSNYKISNLDFEINKKTKLSKEDKILIASKVLKKDMNNDSKQKTNDDKDKEKLQNNQVKEESSNKELDIKKNEYIEESEEKENKDKSKEELDNLKIIKFKNTILKFGQEIPKQLKAIMDNGREKYVDVRFLNLKDTNKIGKSRQKIFCKEKEYEIEVEIVAQEVPISIDTNNNFVTISIEDGRLEDKYLSIEILDENQNIKFLSQERVQGRECSFRTFLLEGKYQAIVTIDGELRSLSESFLINKEDKNKILIKTFKLKNDEIKLTFNEDIKNKFKTDLELKNNIKISYDGFDFTTVSDWKLELKGKDLILKNINHKEKINSLIIEEKSLKTKKGIENEKIVIEEFNKKEKDNKFEPIIRNSKNNISIIFNNKELKDLEINALIKNKENSNIEFLCQERFNQDELKINTILNKGNYILIYNVKGEKYSKEFKVE